MNSEELLTNAKELNNAKDILRDALHADPEALKRLDGMDLDMNAIKTALNFLYNNDKINEAERNELVKSSWRINFRDKPISPEEFITEKYLGSVATYTYDRIKKNFLDFVNPLSKKRNLILYPHISYGKALYPTTKVLTPTGKKEIKDIKIGDDICNSYGGVSQVTNLKDFPNEIVYKFIFEDGREVLACGNHNWRAFESNLDDNGSHQWQVITTNEIVKDIKENPNHIWKFPITDPVCHEKNRHLIPAYEMGVSLGLKYFSLDKSGKIHEDLININAIPKDYLYDSIGNRKDFFRGLIEARNSINKNSSSSFLTYSYIFAEGVLHLIRGLGGFAKRTFLKHDTEKSINIYLIEYSFPLKTKNSLFPNENFECQISNSYIKVSSIELMTDLKGGRCLEVNSDDRCFLVDDYIVTHNSYLSALITLYFATRLSMMRNPWKFYGLNPASIIVQFLCSYSLKKSSESLLEPFNAMLETSPFFEKVHSREKMVQANEDYNHMDHIDRIFYTTASPTSELSFAGGSNIKLVSNPQGLLGTSCIGIVYTELAFFTQAGKALYYKELVKMEDGSSKPIIDLLPGDRLYPINNLPNIVEKIMWEGLDTLYEIELEDGKTVKCNPNHLWKVRYDNKEEVVSTQFIIDNFELSFEIPEIEDSIKFIKIKFIKKISDSSYQRCIKVTNPEGLFVLDNGLITHNSSEYIMELYNKGKQRVDSRFHQAYGSYTILDSSPNTIDNAIDYYINYMAPNDSSNMIIKGAMWETMPENYDLTHTFKVYVGGQGNPPRILEESDPLASEFGSNPKIIEVPESERQFFKDDIVNALKDRAGIPAGSANSLINDYEKIEQMFKYNLKNIYDCIYAPAEKSPSRLIFNQIKDTFFRSKGNKYEYYYKPNIPRCISVDQSYSTDMTGISMCHVERYMDSGELIFVVDFTIAIAPTKDSHVNLEAIGCFIEELRDVGNLRIKAVGFDSFQSETTIQNLTRKGFNVKKISADKSMDPYLNMVALMNSNRLAVGKNIFLKNNLKSLSIVNKKLKMKIDHDSSREVIKISNDHNWSTSPLGMYSKDISDSMVCSIELCRQEFPLAEEQWWGPIKDTSLTPVVERSNAQANLNKFLRSKNLM